jgi:SAM-dependent methyltransferase
MRILDLGSGRRPGVPPEKRPRNCEYVGLDVSRQELEAAPPASYDRLVVADIVEPRAELEGAFDLVISFQVLEHVKPLPRALANARTYLKPGGTFVSQLSGRYAAFAILNRIIPDRAGVLAMRSLMGRAPETVFPAHYDRCWYDALKRDMQGWSEVEVIPRFLGGGYFSSIRPLERLYYLFEDWAVRGDHKNLATHYLVIARR